MTACAPPRSLAEQFAPPGTRGSAAPASLLTTARAGALALSVLAHVAVVAVGLHEGRAVSPERSAPAREPLVELNAPELEPPPREAAPRAPEPVTVPVAPAHAAAASEHAPHEVTPRFAVARSDAQSGGAPEPPVAEPLPEPLVTAGAPAAPHFVLPASAVQASTTGRATTVTPGANVALGAAEPLPEREVDVAARLVAGTPPAYTASAEAAGVEASVPVELVIDTAGAVKSAVLLAHVGYGLDEAALAAVRKYRFAPARRGGKAVSVRMRWVVRFELG